MKYQRKPNSSRWPSRLFIAFTVLFVFAFVGLTMASYPTPTQSIQLQEEGSYTTDATPLNESKIEESPGTEQQPADLDGKYQFVLLADRKFEDDPKEGSKKARLGVHVRLADESLRAQLDIHGKFGLVIEHLVEDSAAAVSGLQIHDVLLKLDAQWLVNRDQLQVLIDSRSPGDEVEIEYMRKGQLATKRVVLDEQKQLDISSTLKALEQSHASLLSTMDASFSHSDLVGRIQQCTACHQTGGDIISWEFQPLLEAQSGSIKPDRSSEK